MAIAPAQDAIEGKKILVEYQGDLFDKLTEIKQDIQSSISYAGGNDIQSLKNVDYVILDRN